MERELNPTMAELSQATLVEVEALLDLLGAHLPEPIRRQRQLAAIERVDRLCTDFMAGQAQAARRLASKTVVH